MQLGHIKPNQLAKSFDQLEAEVRRLSARTFAEVPKQSRRHLAPVPQRPKIEEKYWKEKNVPRGDMQLEEETLVKRKGKQILSLVQNGISGKDIVAENKEALQQLEQH